MGMPPSDIMLGLITFAMAAGGAIVSLIPPANLLKKLVCCGVFIALGAAGFCFVVKLSHESAATSREMNNNLTDLKSQNASMQTRIDSDGVKLANITSTLYRMEKNTCDQRVKALYQYAKGATDALSIGDRVVPEVRRK